MFHRKINKIYSANKNYVIQMLLFHLLIRITRVSVNAVLSKLQVRLIYAQSVLWWRLMKHQLMARVTQVCYSQLRHARLKL